MNDPTILPPPPPAPPAPRRRRIFRALLITQTLLLLLVFGEVITRFLLPVHDPYMHPWPHGYFIPNAASGYWHSENFPPTPMRHIGGVTPNVCYTNSMGMRDIEPPLPDGKSLRLLVIGCSMTEGMAVTDPQQPWPRQFQAALKENPVSREHQFTVMNAGAAGFNCFQMVDAARQLEPRAKSDVWVMGYYGQMWYRNLKGPAGQYAVAWDNLYDREYFTEIFGRRPPWSRFLADHSMLWRWGTMWTHHATGENDTSRPYGDDSAKATLEALTLFQKTAREFGKTPFIVYIPDLSSSDLAHGETHDKVSPQVAEICKNLGLTFIDPTPDFLAEAQRQQPGVAAKDQWMAGPHDPHYNPSGNKAYGRTAAALLAPQLSQIPVPQKAPKDNIAP